MNGSDLSEQEIVLLPKVVAGAKHIKKRCFFFPYFSVCSAKHLCTQLSVMSFWLYVTPVHVSQLELTTSAGSPSLYNPIQNHD